VIAKSAGGQPEASAPLPSTVSLSGSSTGSGSLSSIAANPTSTSTGQDNNNQTKKPSSVGAIVGGVIGGLAFLAAVGVGAWIFLRRRAPARNDEDYPDHPRHSADALMSEYGMQPSQMRLYVRFSSSCPAPFLTDLHRTRTTHPPSPATVTTKQAGYTRPQPTGVITQAPRNCEQLGRVFVYSTPQNTHFLAWWCNLLFSCLIPHMPHGAAWM